MPLAFLHCGGYVYYCNSFLTTFLIGRSQTIGLHNFEALQSCIQTMKREYLAYTRQLTICTKSSKDTLLTPHKLDAQIISQLLIDLLEQCPQLEQLTLNLDGSLAKDVIPSFHSLTALKVLTISNCGNEEYFPLYVSIHLQTINYIILR